MICLLNIFSIFYTKLPCVPTVFPYFSPVWYINLQSSPTINIDINLFPRSLRKVHVPYHIFPLFPCSPNPLGDPSLISVCNVKSRPGCHGFQHYVQYIGEQCYDRAIDIISTGNAVKICCEGIKQQIVNNWMRKTKI